jgi:threonine dehydrogenase-like Zn-dependent dehydrogenase
MELREVPRPTAAAGKYLVRLRANGICGSDLEGYRGTTGRRTPPMIMGHEASGIVEEAPVGGAYALGERVVVFPKPFCGVCDSCKRGLVNVCPSGYCMGVMDANGSMAEFIVLEEKYLLPFSPNLTFAEAALTEPLAVAYRSVYKISDKDIADAEYCMVIGAGTIGLMVIGMLKLRGARNIIASDSVPLRLDLARKLGAAHTIDPRGADMGAAVKEITRGKGCDFVLEAVGIGATASASLDALRMGGTAVWIGNAQKLVEVNMQRIVTSELTIKGNYIYDYQGFQASLKLLERGELDPKLLITHTYPLEEGVKAFKELDACRDGSMVKVILES